MIEENYSPLTVGLRLLASNRAFGFSQALPTEDTLGVLGLGCWCLVRRSDRERRAPDDGPVRLARRGVEAAPGGVAVFSDVEELRVTRFGVVFLVLTFVLSCTRFMLL